MVMPLAGRVVAAMAGGQTPCKQVFATPQTTSWPVHPVMHIHHLGRDDE